MSGDLYAELAEARRQVAELLPYAYAGAEALDVFEPYGCTEATRDEHHALCEAADDMLARIHAGVYGCRCGQPDAAGVTHGPVSCYRPMPIMKRREE